MCLKQEMGTRKGCVNFAEKINQQYFKFNFHYVNNTVAQALKNISI